MNSTRRVISLVVSLAALACTRAESPSVDRAQVNAGIDSLNARISQAYRAHDPNAYAALFTDSAVFEWPAFDTVRGKTKLGEMARSNWATLRDMDLALDVATRRLDADHATEFGAFRQSYSDSTGARSTEFGRYVAYVVKQQDGRWLMDRFFGFSDSTRQAR